MRLNWYRWAEGGVYAMACWLALGGGLILLCLIALTCVSIVGRALVPLNIGIGPIQGLYDITEIGMAVAVFAFLPWCHLQQAHVSVDLCKRALPDGVNRLLDVLFNGAMLGVAGLGAWRLYLGMLDKISYGETTLIAQIPVWIGYAGSLAGAVGFVGVAVFCLLRALRCLAGQPNNEPSHVQH